MKRKIPTHTVQATLAFTSLLLAAGNLLPVSAQQGPKVVQRSLIFSTYDQGRFWPDPKKEPIYGKAAWTPNNLGLNFLIEGPLASGSQLSIAFTKPDGKPWVSVNCETPELAAGEVANIDDCDDIDETLAQPATGYVGVQILNQNALEGTHTVLYKGRLKVATYLDKYKKQTQHVLDEDWRVPTAFLALDKALNPDAPPLIAYFWFKSRSLVGSSLQAFLYYNGKQIAMNTDFNGSANQVVDHKANLEPLDPKQDYSYQLYSFYFTKIHGWAKSENHYDTSAWHLLDTNPGNYEIKVMSSGQLCRVAQFTVGNDGKIVAPGSVEKDSGGNDRMLIPTKVLGTLDGIWDHAAYKTEIYYGNPSPQTSGILSP